jgi:hypothetical protein
MSSTSNVVTVAASRLLTAIAIGAFSTAAAGAGMATVLTGSPSPSAWVAAYQRSHECALDKAARNPSCSVAAARALAEQQVAAQLEQQASQLRAKPAPVLRPSHVSGEPASAAPSQSTVRAAPTTRRDDSGEGDDG